MFNHDILSEKLIVTKRKYTDDHPQQRHSSYAPTRSQVLQTVYDAGGKIDKDEFDKIGITRHWINKNSKLLSLKKASDHIYYKLTKNGKRILKKVHHNETLNLKYDLEDYLREDFFTNNI